MPSSSASVGSIGTRTSTIPVVGRPEASLFYLALGFEEAGDEPDVTHVFLL